MIQIIKFLTTFKTFFPSSMFSESSCLSATPCSRNLTNNLVTMLKDMGHSKVDVSTYNVLVSLPDLTQTSRLRTKDGEGNVLHTVHLYGAEEESTENSTLSSGKTF